MSQPIYEEATTRVLSDSMAGKVVEARLAHVFNSFDNVLVTTSFGTTSALLLHIISRVRPGHPIHFINTGYHFDKTLDYKEKLTRRLGLNLVEVYPEEWRHDFTERDETWNKDPDFCCQINKVEPLERIKKEHDIWVSGLLGYQSNQRSQYRIIEEQSGVYKCYPLIDWSKSLVEDYFAQYGLPRHPLEPLGYESIGCTHCTKPGCGRGGRWPGQSKNECGLH